MATDDTVDEVKVFRKNATADDAADIASSSAELTADKKDLALEAEIESQTEPMGARAQQQFPANFMTPFMNFSPNHYNPFPFFPMVSPSFAPAAPMLSPVAYMAMAMAPQLQMYNQLSNIATILAHSPRFGGGGLNAAATAAFNDHLRSPFANGLVGMGTPKTAPATAPPKINNNQHQQPHLLSSPMHAVTNNLGGISISADRKIKREYGEKRHHSQTVDSQRTPKREKREKREQLLNSEGERVKKPMNAYMIFMKENRERFLAEEHKNPDKNPNGKRIQSADLNRMMGEVWQKMTKADQDPYFVKAHNLRDEHQKLYPNWTARDNYKKNKKKRREKSLASVDNIGEQKKCRARYGVDRQELWCKHCKRKKACLNVRDTDSPVVSSTTNPTTPSSSSSISHHNHQMPLMMPQNTGQQHQHINLMGMGTYHGGGGGGDLPSCSSSALTTGSSSSIGKRSESAHSSASSSNGGSQSSNNSMGADETLLVEQHHDGLEDGGGNSPGGILESKVFINGAGSDAAGNNNNNIVAMGAGADETLEPPKPIPTHTLMDLSGPMPTTSAFQFNPAAAAAAFNFPLMSMMNGGGGGPNFAAQLMATQPHFGGTTTSMNSS